MHRLDHVPGAGLLVDREFSILDGNDRCEIVFGKTASALQGETLGGLYDHDILDAVTVATWEQAVSRVLDGETTEHTEEIRLSPAGRDDTYLYDLRVRPSDGQSDAVCCSLQSVGTSQRYDETITALHAATRDLMTAHSVDDVLERTAVAANEILGFPGTAVRRLDREAGMLRHVSFGARVENLDTRPPYPVTDTPHGRALEDGETVIEDIADDDPYERDVFTQTMYIPIDETGLLSVGTVGGSFDETDVQFAEILAENAGAAIKVVETTSSLREERHRLELLRDVLTRVLRHNIRNDMNIIRGRVEMLGRELEDDPSVSVQDILDSVDNVMALSEKARELGQVVDASHSRTEVNVTSVVDHAVRQARHQYPEATFTVDIESAPPIRAHTSLDIALVNLLENACEHADSDDPTVSVAASVDEETVTVTVSDDGPGIPSTEVAALNKDRETALEHGSGLGLWIVKWVVDQSEGEMVFETDDGTRVDLTFPRATET